MEAFNWFSVMWCESCTCVCFAYCVSQLPPKNVQSSKIAMVFLGCVSVRKGPSHRSQTMSSSLAARPKSACCLSYSDPHTLSMCHCRFGICTLYFSTLAHLAAAAIFSPNNLKRYTQVMPFATAFLFLPFRDVFSQGLPDEYAFVTTFKFRKTSRREDWYLWQIFDKYGIPQVQEQSDRCLRCCLCGGGEGYWVDTVMMVDKVCRLDFLQLAHET